MKDQPVIALVLHSQRIQFSSNKHILTSLILRLLLAAVQEAESVDSDSEPPAYVAMLC